ncbi:hypothetical protein FRB97_003221, partial [Tulasnella sp. 331]
MSSRRNSGSTPINTPIERISFNGNGGEDVTEFLREVKRIALDQGRQRDQEWMIDYVESCLGGSALRWFSKLEEDSLVSWKELRNALLDGFGPPDTKHIPQAAAPAATVTNAVPGLGSGISNLESAIERLQQSIARLKTASAATTVHLQQQIDAIAESVTKSQADLKKQISDPETQVSNRKPQLNTGAKSVINLQPGPTSPITQSSQIGRVKLIEDRTGKVMYLKKGQERYPHYGFTSERSESLIFELLVSESDTSYMWFRLL